MAINKVYVLFKTHLDIGFTDTAENVVKKYMDSFIPNAIHIAKEPRENDSDARLAWTTGSWLIHEFLRTKSAKEKDDMCQSGCTFKLICIFIVGQICNLFLQLLSVNSYKYYRSVL